MSKLIDKILRDISLDERINDGIFTIDNHEHILVLQEYLMSKGIDEKSVVEVTNKMLEGKFPERQAYNKNGILVTFPTPEYKQRALQRGTHFEENPMKKEPNVSFQQPAGQPAATAAQPPTASEQPAEPKQEKPREEPSQLAPATSEPAAPAAPPAAPAAQTAPSAPEAPQVPQATPTAPAVPASVPPTVPAAAPTPPPPAVPAPVIKTPEQKQAEAEYVEKLLTTEISIDEAKKNGWKQTLNGMWYDTSKKVVGKTIYNESLNKQMILVQ
jgi:hypothetical protein